MQHQDIGSTKDNKLRFELLIFKDNFLLWVLLTSVLVKEFSSVEVPESRGIFDKGAPKSEKSLSSEDKSSSCKELSVEGASIL